MSYRKVFVKAAAENTAGEDPALLIPFTKKDLVARDIALGQAGGVLGGATAGGAGGLVLGGMAGNKITEWLSENRNPSASARILGTLLGSGIGGFGGLALGGSVGGMLGGSYTGYQGAKAWDNMRNEVKDMNKLGSYMKYKEYNRMMTYRLLNKVAADNKPQEKESKRDSKAVDKDPQIKQKAVPASNPRIQHLVAKLRGMKGGRPCKGTC